MMKVEFHSTHPDYRSFGEWIEEKKAALLASGNQAGHDSIIAAETKKKQIMAEHGQAFQIIGNQATETGHVMVITEPGPTCEEYQALWNEWMAFYGVTETVTEM